MDNTNPPHGTEASTSPSSTPEVVGRNEPCPCGSGKKYKRCHGVDAAPKLTTASAAPAAGSAIPGFDPSSIDPKMMQQMTQALQRLPRAQLTKLQGMVQRAMAGQDVTKEAAELQKMLPPEFAAMAQIWSNQLMAQYGQPGGGAPAEMSEEEAKRIIAEAAAAGKVSEDQAKELLGADPAKLLEESKKDTGIGKLWSKIRGK